MGEHMKNDTIKLIVTETLLIENRKSTKKKYY